MDFHCILKTNQLEECVKKNTFLAIYCRWFILKYYYKLLCYITLYHRTNNVIHCTMIMCKANQTLFSLSLIIITFTIFGLYWNKVRQLSSVIRFKIWKLLNNPCPFPQTTVPVAICGGHLPMLFGDSTKWRRHAVCITHDYDTEHYLVDFDWTVWTPDPTQRSENTGRWKFPVKNI